MKQTKLYSFPDNRDTHGINTVRLARVWMDEYVDLFYMNRPDLKVHICLSLLTFLLVIFKIEIVKATTDKK